MVYNMVTSQPGCVEFAFLPLKNAKINIIANNPGVCYLS